MSTTATEQQRQDANDKAKDGTAQVAAAAGTATAEKDEKPSTRTGNNDDDGPAAKKIKLNDNIATGPPAENKTTAAPKSEPSDAPSSQEETNEKQSTTTSPPKQQSSSRPQLAPVTPLPLTFEPTTDDNQDATAKIVGPKLLLFGLHPLVQDQALQEFLAQQHGATAVVSLSLKSAFASRYAIVELDCTTTAQAAYKALNGAKLMNKSILVQPTPTEAK